MNLDQLSLPGLDSPLRGEVRNERNTMLYSFFALDEGVTGIDYHDDASGVTITVRGTEAGVATIEDKEVLVYISSLIAEKIAAGETVDRTFRFTAGDLFRVADRKPSKRYYELLEQSFTRLQGSQIQTNIVTGRERTKGSSQKTENKAR